MKLNNKGWGMITFLIIIALLFCLLLLISFLINQYDDDIPKATKRINISEIKIQKNLEI